MHFETSRTRSGSVQIRTPRNEAFDSSLHDTQTGMLLGIPRSARCVQRFDDSLNSAIHITFRTFAAFFIDAKAKRSVVESCINFMTLRRARQDMHDKRYMYILSASEESAHAKGARVFKGCIFVCAPEARTHLNRLRTSHL